MPDWVLMLLPHELLFGSFLVITWARLSLGMGFGAWCPLLLLACLLGSAGIIAWARRNPTPWRWRLRLLYYPVVMGISFYALQHAVPLLGVPGADALLLDWDRALLGETPAVGLGALGRPWFNDLMVLAYVFFFYYLVAGPAHYCLRDLPRFRACFAGLFTAYGLGFLGYTFLPAGGPCQVMTFETPLEGSLLTRWLLPLINAGSNGVDVFPSLHFGASFFLLAFDWQHRRSRFWWLLAPCVAMWFSTVYLRYHYFVDLLGGLVIAVMGLVAAWGCARWFEPAQAQTREGGRR